MFCFNNNNINNNYDNEFRPEVVNLYHFDAQKGFDLNPGRGNLKGNAENTCSWIIKTRQKPRGLLPLAYTLFIYRKHINSIFVLVSFWTPEDTDI